MAIPVVRYRESNEARWGVVRGDRTREVLAGFGDLVALQRGAPSPIGLLGRRAVSLVPDTNVLVDRFAISNRQRGSQRAAQRAHGGILRDDVGKGPLGICVALELEPSLGDCATREG